ncbi:MAG: tyrosine--tRNA ligase, partial [Clostridia bacterium]|nr:tyrosine--tRNA ligase [Clostridia bacterium]
TDGKIRLLDVTVKVGLAKSNGEARRLIQQGGISLDDTKVADMTAEIAENDLRAGMIIKKGKKIFVKLILE